MVLFQTSLSGTAPQSRHEKTPASGGVVVELPATEADTLQAVKSVAADPVVRGTYVYEKEKNLTGAVLAESSTSFGAWAGSGHVFYKIRTGAVAPRHFIDSTDIGTIAVRYVVQAASDTRTRVHIDVVFVEDARRRAHASDGTVEASELKAIQERVQQIQFAERQAAGSLKERREQEAKKAALLRQREEEAAKLAEAEGSVPKLQQLVSRLRHDAERRVKSDGTELKSAPFHKAATLSPLPAGTEVLVLIVTPYWYGIETPDGHRGWLRRDQLEPLP